jgi:hypothetical protein
LFHARIQKFPEGLDFRISGLAFQSLITRFQFLKASGQEVFGAKALGVEIRGGRFSARGGTANGVLHCLWHVV